MIITCSNCKVKLNDMTSIKTNYIEKINLDNNKLFIDFKNYKANNINKINIKSTKCLFIELADSAIIKIDDNLQKGLLINYFKDNSNKIIVYSYKTIECNLCFSIVGEYILSSNLIDKSNNIFGFVFYETKINLIYKKKSTKSINYKPTSIDFVRIINKLHTNLPTSIKLKEINNNLKKVIKHFYTFINGIGNYVESFCNYLISYEKII